MTDLERGVAVFDAPKPPRFDDWRCRVCKRLVVDGCYQRVQFPDGLADVCDTCMSRSDDPRDTADWRDTEIEVV